MRVLSQIYNNSGLVNIKLVKYILQYIFKILDLDFKFDREIYTSDDIMRYINSYFARLKTNRKLTEGYVFILVRAAISHLSKLLLIVILSTCKVEYIIMYKVYKEAVCLKYLLAKLRF